MSGEKRVENKFEEIRKMNTTEKNWLLKQMELAKKDFEDWPDWMKAKFVSPDPSLQEQALKVIEILANMEYDKIDDTQSHLFKIYEIAKFGWQDENHPDWHNTTKKLYKKFKEQGLI